MHNSNYDEIQEHKIVVVTEGSTQKVKNKLACIIGQHVKIDYNVLESYCFQKLSTLQFDLALLTGVIAFVDRNIKRKRRFGWVRKFNITIPVHDPDIWGSIAVSNSLIECLSYLTGDQWSFSFKNRAIQDTWLRRQEYLQLTDIKPTCVLPFSGGMDSWQATEVFKHTYPDNDFLLVQIKNSSAVNLYADKDNNKQKVKTLRIPFQIHGNKNKESTYRSRSFIFYVAAGMAAQLTGCNRVIVTENGQGSLGPSLIPYGDEWPLRGEHPGFTIRLMRLFSAVFETGIEFDHINLWKTKGQMLEEIKNTSEFSRWVDTNSCTRPSRKLPVTGTRVHCGICSNCLLRRVSIHSAQIKNNQETYIWEHLESEDLDTALQPSAKHGSSDTDYKYFYHSVKDLSSLANMSNKDKQHQLELVARELSIDLSGSLEHYAELLNNLVKQHAKEWHSYLNTFPETSLIRQIGEYWNE